MKALRNLKGVDWEAPPLSVLVNSVIVHVCVHTCVSIYACVCAHTQAHEVYLRVCVCVQAERFCPSWSVAPLLRSFPSLCT